MNNNDTLLVIMDEASQFTLPMQKAEASRLKKVVANDTLATRAENIGAIVYIRHKKEMVAGIDTSGTHRCSIKFWIATEHATTKRWSVAVNGKIAGELTPKSAYNKLTVRELKAYRIVRRFALDNAVAILAYWNACDAGDADVREALSIYLRDKILENDYYANKTPQHKTQDDYNSDVSAIRAYVNKYCGRKVELSFSSRP